MKVSMMQNNINFIQDESIIDNELYKSEGWQNFYKKNTNILDDIIKIFSETTLGFIKHKNEIGLTTEFIAEKLNKPVIYIRHNLAIWARWYCTFYQKYGSVKYIKDKRIWVYVSKS